MPNIPTIIDLYSSWQMTENVLLRFSVQNVTNRDYSEALNRMNQSLDNAKEGASVNTTARGRTYIFRRRNPVLSPYLSTRITIMPNRNLIKPLAALLLAALLPHPAFAIDPPPREASRFAMKTNYLQEANEGVL